MAENAAAQLPPFAMLMLSTFCAEGVGVPEDPKRARGYFEQAAELGSAPALFELGFAYETGRDVTRDEKAKKYYKRAAQALAESAVPGPDSVLLFFMAGTALETDARQGFARMIGLPALQTDPWIFDQVSDALARYGSEAELAELRRRGQAAGAHNVYLRLASILAAELREKSGWSKR